MKVIGNMYDINVVCGHKLLIVSIIHVVVSNEAAQARKQLICLLMAILSRTICSIAAGQTKITP